MRLERARALITGYTLIGGFVILIGVVIVCTVTALT